MFASVSRAAAVSDLSAERRWRIVLARDRRYDGAFVYAVQSTGIYCRPSCPSRRPRRAHVAFFPGPEAAELAGFRPCRRCRPGEAAAAVPGVPLVRAVGRLLVATTARGICRISLGSGAKALAAGLRAEFPAAELRRDRSALAASVGALLRYLDGRPEPLDLPLDVRATAFQRRVWEALRRIPYGATRSYAEIARAIGAPSATRAVARACATNPVALVIPCHRVVRADGGLGGYRWGVARKRSLVEQARATTANHGCDAGDPSASDSILPASRVWRL